MGFRTAAPPGLERIRNARRLADALDNEAPTYQSSDEEWVPGAPESDVHSSNHEDGGTDEITVQGLAGVLAEAQPAQAHAGTHATGGGDALTPADIGAILNAGNVPSIEAGTRANQPAAGTANRLYLVTDERVLDFDDGASWLQVLDLAAVRTSDVEAGSATFSGDGTATVFTITHNLGAVPAWPGVVARSADAAADKWVSNVTSTGIEVTFAAAPASGTDNIVLDYHARL